MNVYIFEVRLQIKKQTARISELLRYSRNVDFEYSPRNTFINIVVKASSRMTANNGASRFHVTVKVALYTILQRFQYHICMNNFSVSECLSHTTRQKVNNKSLQRQTTCGRLFQKLNPVAMATTDRNAWLVFLTYLTSRRCFKVSTR